MQTTVVQFGTEIASTSGIERD